jgi:hypothetical protein
MTDSVVDLAARDPETFRRLLREDPAFQERVLDEFMRLYRSDPDFRRAANAILFGSEEVFRRGPRPGNPEPGARSRGPGSVPAGRSPAPGGDFRP